MNKNGSVRSYRKEQEGYLFLCYAISTQLMCIPLFQEIIFSMNIRYDVLNIVNWIFGSQMIKEIKLIYSWSSILWLMHLPEKDNLELLITLVKIYLKQIMIPLSTGSTFCCITFWVYYVAFYVTLINVHVKWCCVRYFHVAWTNWNLEASEKGSYRNREMYSLLS